jgi:NADH-quinone oxidoreductase subunit M
VKKVFFGPVKEPAHEGHAAIGDLGFREIVTLLPIVVLCLVLGLFPQPAIDTARPDLKIIADILAERSRARPDLAGVSKAGQEQDGAVVEVGRRIDGE